MSYLILRDVLDRKALLDVAPLMHRLNEARAYKAQSGNSLDGYGEVLGFLTGPLQRLAAHYIGFGAVISLDRSSVRVQPPTAHMRFKPHQDFTALGLHKAGDRGLTFWVPLCPIDERTPTLAVSRADHGFLPHTSDHAGYSVLPENAFPLEPLFGLGVGDVVVLWPNTIHETHIPADADKSRISLDIRALPWLTIKRAQYRARVETFKRFLKRRAS